VPHFEFGGDQDLMIDHKEMNPYAMHANPTIRTTMMFAAESVSRRCHSHRLRLAAKVQMLLAKKRQHAPETSAMLATTGSSIIGFPRFPSRQ
jgi:hypothetical protein